MKQAKKMMEKFLDWMETNIVMLAIRRGMVLTMPVLMLAAVTNALMNLPIAPYQDFILHFQDGLIFSLFSWIVSATNSIFSLLMILTISYAFAGEVIERKYRIMYPICSICSYLSFTANGKETLNIKVFEFTWMFTAICVTLISCGLLHLIFLKCKRLLQRLYSEGADSYYQVAMSAIIPVGAIVTFFAVFNMIIVTIGGYSNIQDIGTLLCIKLFEQVGTGLGGALIYILLIHLFWFFGIHGDNVLGFITYTYFMPISKLNQEILETGNVPTEIFSHSFFSYFVLLGGTGATLCLLIAIFITSRKSGNRRLAKISAFPAILNINEPILWGMPLILNPIMFIPFIGAPIVIMLFSAFVMKVGIVPVAVYNSGWTFPVIASGVKSTGSVLGAILQIINLAIGTAIYIPFVRLSEKRQTRLLKTYINQLKDKVIEGEETDMPVTLLDGSSQLSSVAAMLAEDLHYAVKKGEVELHYQPQICSDGRILGAEALLRWKHSVLEDYLYPPLVIQLAKEDGYLKEFGLNIIDEAAKTLADITGKTKEPMKMSVNISALQLESPTFCDDVKDILKKYDFGENKLAIEITEQISLSASPVIIDRIDTLREAGIEFIMDDFGMGHSSMMYLKNNKFAYVKLDGSIVKDLLQNNRIGDIISSIKQLSKSLDFEIIAEYVEVQEQREKLQELGCNIYQGWLYSKAIDKAAFEKFLKEQGCLKEK